MNTNLKWYELFRAQALNVANITDLSKAMAPDGELWTALAFLITIVTTNTTGTTAVSEGELQFVPNLFLRSNNSDVILNNVGARGLYHLDSRLLRVIGLKDAISATAGTFNQLVVVPLIDERLAPVEAHKTALDTSRYSSFDFKVTLAALSTLLSSVGDLAATVTISGYVQKYDGVPPVRPTMCPYYANIAGLNPANGNSIDLERGSDLWITDLLAFAQTSATSGVPWSGAGGNTVIKDYNVEAPRQFPVTSMLVEANRRIIQVEGKLAAIPAGDNFWSFVERSRTLQTALPTAGAKLKLNFNTDTLSTSRLDGIFRGVRDLKPVK